MLIYRILFLESIIIQAILHPDMHIAYGWEKVLKGELAPNEKTWFRQLADHELAECKLMQDGMPYRKNLNHGIQKRD